MEQCISLDKENFYTKPRAPSIPSARSFGTDITNSAIPQPDIDELDSSDPQKLGYYAKDIYDYLHSIESNTLPSCDYMKRQTDISEKMRAILIDWLIEVHHKFKLVPETLFLTVNILDRYLDKHTIERNRLQLLGVGAMLIACKYEEIYAPEIRDFVYITDKAYSKEEIIAIEFEILRVLEFNVTVVSSYRFMERYARLVSLEDRGSHLARYLIELALVEYKMLRYNPSLLAASAIYLTHKILKKPNAWPEVLVSNSRYRDVDLKHCAKDLCMVLQGAEKCSMQSVRKKFSLPMYGGVSKIQICSVINSGRNKLY
jgi:cyclin B